jgi:ABC-type branched-subunit amino acid transport system substrate-binding protein
LNTLFSPVILRRVPLLVAVAVLALFGAMATGAQTIGVKPDEIMIVSCSPFSGGLKERGPVVAAGANACFSAVNAQGGINGRKIKLRTCDDHSSGEQAIECFNSCMKNQAFIGAYFVGSPAITKYVRMAEVSGMPVTGFNVGVPAVCEQHSTIFNLRPCYPDEVRKIFHELWDVHGVRKIAVIYPSDAFGAAIRQPLLEALKEHHAAPVAEASFSRTKSDVVEAYKQARAAAPEAIVVAAPTDVLREIIAMRANDSLNAICVTMSPLSDALVDSKNVGDGFLITQVLPSLDSGLPGVDAYIKALKKFDPLAHPQTHGLEAYLNSVVIVEALRRAGPDLTTAKFISALESLHNFDLGIGPQYQVNFNHNKHIGWSNEVLSLAISHRGTLRPVTAADWDSLLKRARAGAPK